MIFKAIAPHKTLAISLVLSLTCVAVPGTTFAVDKAGTCLSNGNSISLGENESDVTNACGEPSNTENSSTPITKDKVVTHWYYLTQLNTNNNAGDSAFSIIRIVVQFNSKDIVTNLHVYTPTNTETSKEDIDLIGDVILEGDTKEQVTSIFGKPFDTKRLIKPEVVGTTQIDTWTYTTPNSEEDSSNTQTLIFTNNKLTEIQN